MWLSEGVQEKIIVTERARAIASLVPIGSGEEVGELLTLVQEGLAAWRGANRGERQNRLTCPDGLLQRSFVKIADDRLSGHEQPRETLRGFDALYGVVLAREDETICSFFLL